ncbi:histidine kinase [Oculatella sp. FACHB-28]|uniref:histidine kinase n=1 Tax=Cyanophyceae TaxID=3028117 RepID=UPI001682BA03|nr:MULTISPECIES: histidine kinase [Cyanophyceae]MBD1996556.1 histidine kinase [Leptolyngbya sp. FACHB-541]MBD2058354.1 histidine kinase [Oculatella sp. FACHB-28]
MEALPKQPISPETSLQLLLFVDKRPSSHQKIRQIRHYLKDLRANYAFDLQIIDVGEQPHMAEHFKLVATPALIKIHPEPRQTLAGTNLVAQLEHWWMRWQRSVEEAADFQSIPEQSESDDLNPTNASETLDSVAYSAEFIQLSDEIFRLKQEKEELRDQLQFKDRLIAMLAHDLRNPLTAASIALETLELGNEAKENGHASPRLTPALTAQLIRHARTQTKAIDRMITDVLQAAKGTGGEFQIQPQQLDLGALCLEVLNYLKGQFQAKSQQLTTDIPSDLPKVYADRDRIQQVLINLLDNASKYTPTGGSIELSILHRTTQKIQVSVCDTGLGIPNENCERIFEDRFRLERDEAKDGYGIGLSLCQRVIRAHYGQIWVDSVPNQGSCFHFTLPVYRF